MSSTVLGTPCLLGAFALLPQLLLTRSEVFGALLPLFELLLEESALQFLHDLLAPSMLHADTVKGLLHIRRPNTGTEEEFLFSGLALSLAGLFRSAQGFFKTPADRSAIEIGHDLLRGHSFDLLAHSLFPLSGLGHGIKRLLVVFHGQSPTPSAPQLRASRQ